MPHEYAGHYAAKHPPGSTPDPEIASALKERVREGRISCAAAHAVAERLKRPPAEVGRTIDLMEIRLSKCQMGLFGYTPEKKIVTPAETVDPGLADAIRALTRKGRIPCKAAWDLADRQGISRLDLAAACEALKIKVSPCQIGAF